MSRRLALLVLATAGILASPRSADACTCVFPGSCGADGDFWRVASVFVGRVESIERAGSPSGPRLFLRRTVRIQILEGFRGIPGRQTEVTVLTGSGGGDCGYPFRVGETYLVYANRQDESGPLTTNICTRTRRLGDANADVEYARQVVAGQAPPGRVAGEVTLHVPNAASGREDVRPMPGVRVLLEKDGSVVSAMSDEKGRYSFEAIAAGTYKVRVEPPQGYYTAYAPASIDRPDPRSCQQMDIRIQHDGRVAGRVVDSRGRGVASLKIEIIPTIARKDISLDLGALTRQDGTYEVSHVPPGRFHVVINGWTDPQDDCVQPAVWQPGTQIARDAAVVRIGPSQRLTIGDLTLPETLSFVNVSGVVVGTDGAPVIGASVFLKGESAAGVIINGPATTDASGLFTIAAPSGRQCRIFAELSGHEGSRRWTASSEPLRIEVTPEMSPQRLVLRRQY